MSAVVMPEKSVDSESVLPAQFRDIWRRAQYISAERTLALAVLHQVVLDLQKFCFAGGRRHQRMYMQAYQWVASEARDWPYSFANLCDMLALSPEALRAELLGKEAPFRAADTAAGATRMGRAA